MTHIERFKALMEAIKGAPVSNAELVQLAEDFASYRRDQLERLKIVPAEMTRDQQASCVLDAYAYFTKSVQGAMLARRTAKAATDDKLRRGFPL